ncbi:magnesium ion transporter [Gnomoniopsis smithogilvyi]|uniref:Magnesium transporter n=1 Tax=Gnomoniopsis smithogilvyi TaxID=1191159 RepID=A0A9W9CTV0_9PEZI|nr:magnesium ion transporter [Gnomoniopsis smithogilvyi]
MRPTLQHSAPSRRLLRFLRFQSEGIPFFVAHRRHHQHSHALAQAAGPCRDQSRCLSLVGETAPTLVVPKSMPRSKPLSRPFSSSRPRHPESIVSKRTFNLENILPRHLKRVRSPGLYLTASNSVTISRRFISSEDTDDGTRKKTSSERLWGPNAVKPDFQSHSTEELEDSIFTSSMGRRAKAALEPVLRCTEVDEKGDAILTDGAFKKTELIAKYGLMPRDLRKIDSSNLPHMLVRPSAILLNLLHLRVLIKHDRVLLFDVYGSSSSSAQSEFMYELQGKLRQKQAPGTSGGLPYEFRALEVVLMSVTSELWKEFSAVQEPVMHLLSDLEDDVDREKLRILLVLSKKVSTFEQKARLVRDAIEELLEADDDLSQMYLTEKTRDIRREQDDHTEIEMLLESYHKICDEVVQEAGNLVSGIRNTEEIIRAILDANRNSLMLLELQFSVYTLGLALGTFLAGLYGMNLENYIEETQYGFPLVSVGSTVAGVLVLWLGMVKLRKVQRVRMNQPSKRPRKGIVPEQGDRDNLGPYGLSREWYRDDSPMALLEAKHKEKLRRLAQMKERRPQTGLFRKLIQKFQ